MVSRAGEGINPVGPPGLSAALRLGGGAPFTLSLSADFSVGCILILPRGNLLYTRPFFTS